MAKPTLYLMLGYPGAGKTTAAKLIAELTGAVHLSSDAMRLKLFPEPKFTEEEHAELYETLDKLTGQLLEEGKDVIYDANLNRLRHREEKYTIAKQTGAKTVLIWVQTDKPLAKQRAGNESRAKLWHEHPDDMFDRLVDVFEDPMEDEKYLTFDGTKITSNYVRDYLGL